MNKKTSGRLMRMVASVVFLILIAIVLSNLLGLQSIVTAHVGMDSTADSVQLDQLYWYREVGLRYDSVSALCIYGEIFLVSDENDSAGIWFNNIGVGGQNTFIGSRDSVNELCASMTFLPTENSKLCFFRCLAIKYSNSNQQDIQLPDSVTWVLHLMNKRTKEVVYTLDSVCVMKKDTGAFTFPEYTGVDSDKSRDLKEVILSNIPNATTGDSLFTQVTVFSTGRPNYYWYTDELVGNSKFSDGGNQNKASEKYKESALPLRIKLHVYPNPSAHRFNISAHANEPVLANLSLIASNGRVVKSINGLEVSSGKNIFSFDMPKHETTGVYFLILSDYRGATLAQEKLLYFGRTK